MMSETNSISMTCSAAMEEARRQRLNEALGTLATWADQRERGDFNTETTLTMLARKVQETIDSVDKAGWRAAKEFEQNQTGHKPPTEDE